MTAAFDSRVEALKEAAVLRSLADQVASPVVAGRKSRKALTGKQRGQWSQITEQVVTWPAVAQLLPAEMLADLWRKQCRTAGIGAGLFGWIIWNWAFPLLLELAKLWIESRQNNKTGNRD
jgi:hypothetical protein